MNQSNEPKNIFTESKCDKCGNEYPKFDVIENGKIKTRGHYPDCQCVVELKLKRWQIPILLGGLSLGSALERICSMLYEAIEHGHDSDEQAFLGTDYSSLWRHNVGLIMDEIKQQSSIEFSYWECASNDKIRSIIKNFVDREVERRIDLYNGSSINRQWLSKYLPEEYSEE